MDALWIPPPSSFPAAHDSSPPLDGIRLASAQSVQIGFDLVYSFVLPVEVG